MLRGLAQEAERQLCFQFMPGMTFALDGGGGSLFWQDQIAALFPFYGYSIRGRAEAGAESAMDFRTILLAEAEDEADAGTVEADPAPVQGDGQAPGGNPVQEESLEALLRAENEAAAGMLRPAFVPHGKQETLDLSLLGNYETLIRQCYTIDANTTAGSDQLDVGKLMGQDMRISKEGSGPQILIYHTHSQEGYADSIPGDASTSIMGVGERLAEVLRDTYGYEVVHHLGQYDKESRDDSYSVALPEIEKVLEEYPSIQVVIDLHRDAMPETVRLAIDLDGRPTARFMFFNGLSRTKKTGNIAYLYNENLEDNLAFSFQMQRKAMEYYPGLARKIYLKGYRYNMHLASKYLLVELGAQNNTLEEAMNACDPLAHLLDLVLSGDP